MRRLKMKIIEIKIKSFVYYLYGAKKKRPDARFCDTACHVGVSIFLELLNVYFRFTF